jgi:hypothetical protein
MGLRPGRDPAGSKRVGNLEHLLFTDGGSREEEKVLAPAPALNAETAAQLGGGRCLVTIHD